MEKKKVFYQRLKIILLLILAVIIFLSLAIAGPYAIDKAYDWPCKMFFTSWESSDVLAYYGTLLGASATITAVILTIKFTRESAEKDRKNAENIDHRNIGTPVCFEFIESCDFEKILYTLDNIHYERDKDIDETLDNVKRNLDVIYQKARVNHAKFQVIYPNLSKELNLYFSGFVKEYFEVIGTIKVSLVKDEKSIFCKKSALENLMSYNNVSYSKFLDIIRKVIFSYDCDKILHIQINKNIDVGEKDDKKVK